MATTGWWEQIKGVFATATESSAKDPVVHATLTRHRDHAAEFDTWNAGVVAQSMRTWLGEAYGYYLQHGRPPSEAIDFLDTQSSKGFVLHFDELQYTLHEAQMFQLTLRERVLRPGPEGEKRYRTQVADTKTYQQGDQTERTDRYYLKPVLVPHADPAIAAAPNSHTADQFGQGFGNILIELVVRDERPWRLRFSATIYHDRVYQEAEGFGALVTVLTQ